MPEQPDGSEGWGVRQRIATTAAVGTLLGLLLLLTAAGYFYDRALRPKTSQSHASFPAPGLETSIHAGGRDPHLASAKLAPDPAIEAAKNRIVVEGLPGWERQR